MNTKSYIAVIGVLVVLLGVYGYLTFHQAGMDATSSNQSTAPQDPSKRPTYRSRIDEATISSNWNNLLTFAASAPLGNPNAEYTLIEVGDFQCPQCGKVHTLIENLIAKSGGKAKLYFVNYPLPMHPHSRFAAEASIAAANQGKFWQMYNVLYGHQDELIPSEVQYYSGIEIPSMDMNKYLADVGAPATISRVAAQYNEVQSLKIDSTPTLFVRKTSGGVPSWYVGLNDEPDQGTKGMSSLLSSPPWTHS